MKRHNRNKRTSEKGVQPKTVEVETLIVYSQGLSRIIKVIFRVVIKYNLMTQFTGRDFISDTVRF